nr:MAG TPA: hypothetical protein [Caudoviricetes sp.]
MIIQDFLLFITRTSVYNNTNYSKTYNCVSPSIHIF